VAPLVGLADLIGMAVHGWGAPTTALSLPVWRSVLSSPLPRLVPSHRVHIPALCWYWADPEGYRGYWDYC
jgi:hypothetical protein